MQIGEEIMLDELGVGQEMSLGSLNTAVKQDNREQYRQELDDTYGTLPNANKGEEMGWGQSIGEAFRAPYYTGGGLVGGLGLAASDLIPGDSDIEQSIRDWSQERVDYSKAFDERAKDSGQYGELFGHKMANPASYATEIAAMVVPPGRATKTAGTLAKIADYGLTGAAVTYPYLRYEDMEPGEAAIGSAMGGAAASVLGPAFEWAISALNKPNLMNANSLKELPKSVRDKFIYMGERSSIEPEELFTRAKEQMSIRQANPKSRSQLVKAGAEAGDADTRKLVTRAASETEPKVSGDFLREADMRRQAVDSILPRDSVLRPIIADNTVEVGERLVVDWPKVVAQAGEELNAYPELATRLNAYAKLDDVGVARSMFGKSNKLDNLDIVNTGARPSVASTLSAGAIGKVLREVAKLTNIDYRTVDRIAKSAKAGPIRPIELSKILEEAGADPVVVSRIMDDAANGMDEVFPERAGDNPYDPYANAPEDVIYEPGKSKAPMELIDEAELDARLIQNKANVEENWPVQRIIDEFSDYGEDLDRVLQEGLDAGLRGGKLRNYVYTALKKGGDSTSGFNASLPREVAGAQAGWEVDDEGNISYNPVKGAVGAAAGNMTRGRNSIVNKLGAEGLGNIGQKIAKATGVNANPNIIPDNSSMGQVLTSMKNEGKPMSEIHDYFSANMGEGTSMYSGNDFSQFMNNLSADTPYKMISKGVEASKLLPNKQPLRGTELINAMKSRGVTAEELKFSGFEDYANSLNKPVNKREVEQWWKDNAGKELPMQEVDAWDEYTAADYGHTVESKAEGEHIEPKDYEVNFREYPKINEGLTKEFQELNTVKFKSDLYYKLDEALPKYGDSDYDVRLAPVEFPELRKYTIQNDVVPENTLSLIDKIENNLKETNRLTPERKLALTEARGMIQEEVAKPTLESFTQVTKDKLEELSWTIRDSEGLQKQISNLRVDPSPSSYGLDKNIQQFKEETANAFKVDTTLNAGESLGYSEAIHLKDARNGAEVLADSLDDGPAKQALTEAISHMEKIPDAGLTETADLRSLARKELSTAKQHLLGEGLEFQQRRVNQMITKLDNALINKTKTDVPDYSKSIMAQVNEQLDKTLDMSWYQSDHMTAQEPMYLRTSTHTKDGKRRLVIQEPQSDAFAGKDTRRLKAANRMPHSGDWLEKDLEDAAMKALREGHDEIVIPLSSADSETDVFMIGGRPQEKPIKAPKAISETSPYYRDATTNINYIGKGKKTKSATTPIYYNSIVVNQANKLAKRLGGEVHYETVGNTNSLVIDISNIDSPTFSLYGKPGQFK